MSTAKLYNVGYISSARISGEDYAGGLDSLEYPPLTYIIQNIRISSQQTIPITQFTTPLRSDGTRSEIYILQASACDSSQASRDGLCIQLLSGSNIIYTNSSATLLRGNPLAHSWGGKTTIRFGYSSQNDGTYENDGIFYGTAMMQIKVI